ncbi:MAG: cytochrome ubiquinol oxidase subunit I [Gemmatimonadetes bacterium]|nr:cytochrome ubiquinol oxidase subunit I [Gemmatimonadota bacterium]
MDPALFFHRFHFAFTISFHYLFPQFTMGMGLLIVILKTKALRTGDARFEKAARFWGKVFGLAFAMGVVTGIPMEFQFGTNWARFSEATGGVIGQTLAMEGTFAFFLESSFLGLFLFGHKRLSPRMHWLSAFAVFAGSWISGFFIVATNAFMQNPVGYEVQADGALALNSFGSLLLNPWLLWQYLHTMAGAVVTGSFVMAGIGAYYLLLGQREEAPAEARGHAEYGRIFVRLGVLVGLPASVIVAFPTGDMQAVNVAEHQPAAFASMEGLFESEEGAGLVLIGQPDMENMRLDNPIEIPRILSFLTYRRFDAEVVGLNEIPRDEWPDNVPLHYYAYHIMVGLGTLFIGAMMMAAWLLIRGKLFESRAMLWVLMFAAPLPFIANTTGWMTAELGRQPWLVYGVLRTEDGYSSTVSSGNAIFSLLGFMGLYLLLGILFLFLAAREIGHGPGGHGTSEGSPAPEKNPGGGGSRGGGAGGVPHTDIPSAFNEGR